MSASVVPVILSGGSGTRLWPVSRPEHPKQLLSLIADKTMLQLTALRTATGASADIAFGNPILVANTRHALLIENQLAGIGIVDGTILLEPFGRNTAPAIAMAALAANDPADVLLVMPSDHVIVDVTAFHSAITQALPMVADEWLVTFGITPDGPETGYGYIQIGDDLSGGVHAVTRFVEKPDAVQAAAMLEQGNYAWNAGIFLFRADAYLAALTQFQPKMLECVRTAMERSRREGRHIYPDSACLQICPSDSIDYAIMEKAEKVACLPVNMGWADVGSWDSLHAISPQDVRGNALRGDIISIETSRCLVHSDGPRVSLVGVQDLIVVISGDDIMILPRGKSQEVRKIVDALKDR